MMPPALRLFPFNGRLDRRQKAAIALAMIASLGLAHGLGARQQSAIATGQPRLVPTPMPFERPGENFPGSAFYYLDDDIGPAQHVAQPVAQPSGHAATPSQPAAGFRFRGSARDRVRAQYCLTAAIYYEAALEPDTGQRAVAQVVLNRVAHPSYPDTICDVVFQGSERTSGCQFSFTCDGSLARAPDRRYWLRASRVATRALAGAVDDTIGLATHYHTIDVNPFWAKSLDTIATIGAHRFYGWRGIAGARSAFYRSYRGHEPVPAPHPRSALADLAAADPLALQRAFEAERQGSVRVPAPLAVWQVADHGADRTEPGPDSRANALMSEPQSGSGAVQPRYRNSGQWIARPPGQRPGAGPEG